MDFGDRLKQIRTSQGLSQEQLAEKIGVSRQAITKWETNLSRS
ncbi:MAG: helix-turn-helix transcriptional regulator [Clostridia bacterium]|nr:helix-turn-helix transcriptional regulator [Clostridia bacterium]